MSGCTIYLVASCREGDDRDKISVPMVEMARSA